MTRLALTTLDRLNPGVRRPAYDPAALGCGVLHLGVGAFHRAHQAVFTEDAIEAEGGCWGILGVSLRQGEAGLRLNPQDGLYTLERRTASPDYRVIGALRRILTAPEAPGMVLDAFADAAIHVVTLTVTEPGYALGADGTLDLAHPDVAADLLVGGPPRSTIGWIAAGLARRRADGGGPITVISCDNLRDNGRKLEATLLAFADRQDPKLAGWIRTEARFPNTMVDAITPASDDALLARVEAATGLRDEAAVQREPFAQWVIEDRFAGPLPAWSRVGVEITADVGAFERLKLHVLNAAHSALAYLGPARGHAFVRQAIADPALAGFLDAMVAEEIAPALRGLDVAGYWRTVRARFAEPAVDHRLDQIARDGAAKLRERIHPLILANARAGRPAPRLGQVVLAWLESQGLDPDRALGDPALFADAFRAEPAARAVIAAPAA